MFETMFFFSVQLCVNPWTVLCQADLQMYLFWGGKGMFLCFYVKKVLPVDMASTLQTNTPYVPTLYGKYGRTSEDSTKYVFFLRGN
jgi:hypothetical protein